MIQVIMGFSWYFKPLFSKIVKMLHGKFTGKTKKELKLNNSLTSLFLFST